MGTDIALEQSSAAVVKIWPIQVDVSDPNTIGLHSRWLTDNLGHVTGFSHSKKLPPERTTR
jgi:hypothetical protein